MSTYIWHLFSITEDGYHFRLLIVAFNSFYLKNRWGGTGSLLPDGLIYDGVSDNPIKVTKVFQVSFILAFFPVQKNLLVFPRLLYL